MNTQPTLCLVMDGERIIQWEIFNHEEIDEWFLSGVKASNFTLLTIPLSLCALAPEMKGVLLGMYAESDGGWLNQHPNGAKLQSLLSRLPADQP